MATKKTAEADDDLLGGGASNGAAASDDLLGDKTAKPAKAKKAAAKTAAKPAAKKAAAKPAAKKPAAKKAAKKPKSEGSTHVFTKDTPEYMAIAGFLGKMKKPMSTAEVAEKMGLKVIETGDSVIGPTTQVRRVAHALVGEKVVKLKREGTVLMVSPA